MQVTPMRCSAAVLASAIILTFCAALAAGARTAPQQIRIFNHRAAQANADMAQGFSGMPAEGWLGVTIDEVSAQRARAAKLPKPEGVYVTGVESNSPAAKAGIQAHDIIVAYNGQSVEGVLQFRRLVRETPPGRSISIRVFRDGSKRTLTAQLSSRPMFLESRMRNLQYMMRNMPMPQMLMNRPEATVHPLVGIRAMEIEGQLGQYFQAPGGRGILVVSVMAGSAAAKAGLKAGDVIDQVAGQAVQTIAQLEQGLRNRCSANGVSLGIVRKGMTLVLNVPMQCAAPSASSGSSA